MLHRCKLSFILAKVLCGRLLSRVQPHTISIPYRTMSWLQCCVCAILTKTGMGVSITKLSNCHSKPFILLVANTTLLIFPTDHFQVQNPSHLYHSSPASRQRLMCQTKRGPSSLHIPHDLSQRRYHQLLLIYKPNHKVIRG
jgi:hypothetical protein